MASAAGLWMQAGSVPLLSVSTGPVSFQMQHVDDEIAGVFLAPDSTQAIIEAEFNITATQGSLTNLYQVRLEGVDASGNPDGTDVGGGGSETAKIFTPATGLNTITFTTAYTPSEGQELAVVIYASATPNGTDNATFTISKDQAPDSVLPYVLTNDDGAGWVKAGDEPCIAVKYFDGLIVPGTEIAIANPVTLYDANDNPDERGNLWVPSNDCTLSGLVVMGRWGVATDDCEFQVRNAALTELVSITVDGKLTGNAGAVKYKKISFEDIAITGGANYYLTMEATHATSTIQLYVIEMMNAAHRLSRYGPLSLATLDGGSSLNVAATEKHAAVYPIISAVAAGGGGTTSILGGGNLEGGFS